MKLKNIFYLVVSSTILLLALSYMLYGDSDYFLEILKVIITGYFASVIAVLLPLIYNERKYEFELHKEAKRFYSESLTSLMYLNDKLPYFRSAEEAFRYLEEIHCKKHLAETYYEYLEIKNRNAEFRQRRIWPPNSDPGKLLDDAKKKVEKIANNWNRMSQKKRFEYFSSEFRSHESLA